MSGVTAQWVTPESRLSAAASSLTGWNAEFGEARQNGGVERAFGVIEREFDFA
jgi:hypothetical protein